MNILRYGFQCGIDAFHLDLRSLALFRIFMGVTVVADVIDRMTDMTMHYSDLGFCPRGLFITLWAPWVPSVYFMTGVPMHLVLLFLLHICIALCWAAGYRTRLTHFLTWFFTWSLQNRNVPNGHGGDMYMRMMLFWSFFLPLGAAFSVDELLLPRAALPRRHRAARRGAWSWDFAPVIGSNKVVGAATAGFLLQMTVMYVVSVLHKDGPEWRSLGTSTWMALNLNYFRTPLGQLLYQLPRALMKYLTFSVLVAEVAGPLLCISPLLPLLSRLLGVFCIVSLHFGFGLAMRLGVFTPVTITVGLACLPTGFWDVFLLRLLRGLTARAAPLAVAAPRRGRARALLLAVREFMVLEGTLPPTVELEGLQGKKSCSKAANCGADGADDANDADDDQGREGQEDGSAHDGDDTLMVVDAGGRAWRGAAAACELIAQAPLGWAAAYVPRDALFGARNARCSVAQARRLRAAAAAARRRAAEPAISNMGRTWDGTWDGARRMAPRLVLGAAHAAVLFLAFCYVLVWNSIELEYINRFPVQSWLEPVTISTGLEQRWSMFSHSPPYDSFWIEIQGVLVDRRQVDLFDDGGLWDLGRLKPWNDSHSWSETHYEWRNIRNHRHFKYWENFINVEGMREEFGRWLCREFSKRHEGLDALMEHYTYVQFVHTEDEGPGVYNGRNLLHGHVCFKEEELSEEQRRAWTPPEPVDADSELDADSEPDTASVAIEVDPAIEVDSRFEIN